MRYYIVSIVSIFLALGIGIFIGFMLDAQELLVNEKEDIVNQLEVKFQSLENEKTQVKEKLDTVVKENETYKRFNQEIFPKLIEGRLKGSNILLLQINDESSYSEVYNMLEVAGANVNRITLYEKNLMNNLHNLSSQLNSDILNSTDTQADKSLLKTFYPEVIEQITSEDIDCITSQSIQRNLLRVEGDFKHKIDYFVIGGEFMDESNTLSIYKGITDYLVDHKYPVVMIQKGDSEESIFTSTNYDMKKIPTIKDIDTILGKVSLVFTIEGL